MNLRLNQSNLNRIKNLLSISIAFDSVSIERVLLNKEDGVWKLRCGIQLYNDNTKELIDSTFMTLDMDIVDDINMVTESYIIENIDQDKIYIMNDNIMVEEESISG